MSTDHHPPLDAWEPMSLSDVAALFDGAPFRWWITGGRALELHVGRSWREHGDTDVGILRGDAPAVSRWLEGWTAWVAARGDLTPWLGNELSEVGSENNVWIESAHSRSWCLDLTVNTGTEEEWIYRRDRSLRRPWPEAVLVTRDGLPYLAPDLQLLFKSTHLRPKDDADMEEVAPDLTDAERRFLREHLPDGHPWRVLMG